MIRSKQPTHTITAESIVHFTWKIFSAQAGDFGAESLCPSVVRPLGKMGGGRPSLVPR